MTENLTSERWCFRLIILSFTFLPVAAAAAEPALDVADIERLSVTPTELNLPDSRSRQQLIVTAHAANGHTYDVTRQVKFHPDGAAISVDGNGVVRPIEGGNVLLRIKGFGKTVHVKAKVGDLSHSPPVSFTNEVMAVLGKSGCNAGSCHGHASGKNGFKLSLRGYHPAFDLMSLTHGQFGR